MAIEIPAMKKIASLLDCSICFETLTDPVLLCSNQHTVDRACALQWLSKNPSCPECREAIDPTKPLNSNRLVVQLLDVYGNINPSDLQQQKSEAPEVEIPSPLNINESEASPDPASLIPSAPPLEPDELFLLKTNAETQEVSTALKVVANSDRMNIAPERAESPPLEDQPLPPTIRLSFAVNGNSGFRLFSSSVCQQISERTAKQAGINFQHAVDISDNRFIARSNPFRKCQIIEAELTQRPRRNPSSQKESGYVMKCLNEGQYVLNKHKKIYEIGLSYRFVEVLSGKKTASTAHTTIKNSDGSLQLGEESFSQILEQYHEKGLSWLKSSASSGNLEAQFCLGFIYANGRGVPRSLPIAIEWYQKAADQGLIDAQNNLKVIKEHYRVMSQELEQAYTQKVIQVLQYAKNNMNGRYAYQHNGLATDYGYLNLNEDSLLKFDIPLAQKHGLIDQIISRLQLAVDQNGVSNKVDLNELAKLVLSPGEKGFGWVLEITLRMLKLDSKSLREDLFKAVSSMKHELDEFIVKYSYQNAFKWYEKQAKRNNAEALYIVGKMLYKGQGVDVNYVTARESWKKAANLGHTKAKEELVVRKV